MLATAIKSFPDQFKYEPVLNGDLDHKQFHRFLIAGMGGSHLAADILQEARPDLAIRVHSDYDLPQLSARDQAETLVILFSYSGNTEEVLSAAEMGMRLGLKMGAIAVGGKLIEFAKANVLPFIELPNTGIQPRSALGFSLRALFKMVGAEDDLTKTHSLASRLNPEALEKQAATIAQKLAGRVPVIYAANARRSIAYNWKIKFNENVKIPAFFNQVPELNHNEMNGFDVIDSTRVLSEKFTFIFLRSELDHPHNQKRFTVLEQLYQARNLPVITIDLRGADFYEQVFQSLLLADWVTVHLSDYYGTEAEKVPMVEEFKHLIAR